jgi:hypothetical protein
MKVPSTFIPVEPDYLHPDVKAPYKLHRLDAYRNRYYFWFGRKYVKTYLSLTSTIRAVLPKGYRFYEWVAEKGKDSEKIKMERAAYGTAVHIESFRPLIEKKGYDFDYLKKRDKMGISNYQKLFPKEYWEVCHNWYYGFHKSLLAFWQFVQERVVEVIAVEIPLASKQWGYAGTLDLVCKIRWGKKVAFAIIDLKSFFFTLHSSSTSKNFYADHEFQLVLQKNLWLENFGKPEEDILLFNFSPNNWRDKPTYTLKNQTKTKFDQDIKVSSRKYLPAWQVYLATLPMYDVAKPPSSVMDFEGSFKDISEFNWEDHIMQVNL